MGFIVQGTWYQVSQSLLAGGPATIYTMSFEPQAIQATKVKLVATNPVYYMFGAKSLFTHSQGMLLPANTYVEYDPAHCSYITAVASGGDATLYIAYFANKQISLGREPS